MVRSAARVVHDLDRVVFVLARLDPNLDVALHGAGQKLKVVSERDDGLHPIQAAHELIDAFGDTLDLVDQVLVLAEPAQRAFAAFDALGGRVDVGERAFEAIAGAIHLVDDLSDLTAFLWLGLVGSHQFADIARRDAHIFEDSVDLGRAALGNAFDVRNDVPDRVAVFAHGLVQRIGNVR